MPPSIPLEAEDNAAQRGERLAQGQVQVVAGGATGESSYACAMGSGAGTFPGKPGCYEQAGQGLGVTRREKMPAKTNVWG